MASLLSFFLSPHGKGFIDLGRRRGRRPAQFLFEFFDALFGRFQLSLLRHDDLDQAIEVDPTVTDILFELLDGVHASSFKKTARAQLRQFRKNLARKPPTPFSENGHLRCSGRYRDRAARSQP